MESAAYFVFFRDERNYFGYADFSARVFEFGKKGFPQAFALTVGREINREIGGFAVSRTLVKLVEVRVSDDFSVLFGNEIRVRTGDFFTRAAKDPRSGGVSSNVAVEVKTYPL